jgi:succinylglutamic semialdehyde dehydrogenase
MNIQGNFIENAWKKGSGQPFISTNPATGDVLWEGYSSSQKDIDEAVDGAKKAFSHWASLKPEERASYLLAFAAELKSRQHQLAEAISKDVGKPLWESKGEIQAMIQKVDISIQAQQQRCGTTRQNHSLGTLITRHRPHGVIAVFGPFNFPGHLPNGHIIPALLAGNTVIFKPSEQAPLVAEAVMECWERTALPKGVINMVQGARETGQLLSNHALINGLFFTGSFSTGKKLSETFGPRPEKILALEMGGNNPLIVSSIANANAAAYAIIQSSYLTSGQRCTCARRLILVEDVAGPIIEELKKLIPEIKVGPYTSQPEPYMGPVISSAAADSFLKAQNDLINHGGQALVPMSSLTAGTGLVSPALIDVTHCHDLPDEEIFGPLLQVIIASDFQQAVKEANKTTYGLAAGLLSDSLQEYEVFKDAVKAGVVNWNVPLTGASSAAPFGGIGRSGNHRPSAYYAADYCNYPVASIESGSIKKPSELPPGLP